MNPFIKDTLTAVARAAVIWIAAKLGQDITSDQAAQIVLVYVIPAAMLIWSLYQKYTSRQKLATALASNVAMTEKQVENVVKSGGAASVLTPKHEIPQ